MVHIIINISSIESAVLIFWANLEKLKKMNFTSVGIMNNFYSWKLTNPFF